MEKYFFLKITFIGLGSYTAIILREILEIQKYMPTKNYFKKFDSRSKDSKILR